MARSLDAVRNEETPSKTTENAALHPERPSSNESSQPHEARRSRLRAWEVALRVTLRVFCLALDPEVEAVVGDALGSSVVERSHNRPGEAFSATTPVSLVMMELWSTSQGLPGLKQLKQTSQPRPVIVCTSRADKAGVLLGLGAGANAYLIKPFSPDQLLDAFNNVLTGANFLCPRAQQLLAGAFDQWGKASRHLLSAREDEIMSCILAGLSDKAIATELSISASTVHAHMAKVFAKLGVASRGAAIQRYWQLQ